LKISEKVWQASKSGSLESKYDSLESISESVISKKFACGAGQALFKIWGNFS
jgi:hypothetical protein